MLRLMIRNVNMWQLSMLTIFMIVSFADTLSILRVPPADDSSIQICDPNEFFDPCSGCEATCTNPGPIACRRICIRPGRCRCLNGYVRSAGGECIEPEECPGSATTDEAISSSSAPDGGSGDLDCGDNEYLNDCGGCDGTCENPNPACIAICGRPACRCSTGFVRHGGKCISAELCPPPNLTPCSTVRCGWGQQCVVIQGQARCVGPRQEDPCALVDCVSGKVCKVQGARALCVDPGAPTNPCAAMLCAAGTQCIAVPLNCFVAPCPPDEAMCVPIRATTGPQRG